MTFECYLLDRLSSITWYLSKNQFFSFLELAGVKRNGMENVVSFRANFVVFQTFDRRSHRLVTSVRPSGIEAQARPALPHILYVSYASWSEASRWEGCSNYPSYQGLWLALHKPVFRWRGVLNGLGSCGVLVKLRMGLRGCLLAAGVVSEVLWMLILSSSRIIFQIFGSVTLIRPATKSLYWRLQFDI